MKNAPRTTFRALIAAGGLVLLAAASLWIWKPEETGFGLDRATIELLEAKISLPEGAYPLDRYVRFYVQIPSKPRYVLGTFVERSFSSTLETPSEQMPPIVFPDTTFGVNDLPCPAQIFVWYDLQTQETHLPRSCTEDPTFPP
jgi:hypothetical protein